MSFILDALKKSETDRQRQNGPALFEVKVAPPRSGLPLWAVGLGVLLAVNLIIVAWVLLRRPAQAETNATQGQAVQAASDRRGGQGSSQNGSGAWQGGQSGGGTWQGQPGQGGGQAWQGAQNAQGWQSGGQSGPQGQTWQGGGQQPGQQGWQGGQTGQPGGQSWQAGAPGQGGWQGGQAGQGAAQGWGGQPGYPGGPTGAPQGQQGQAMAPVSGTTPTGPLGQPAGPTAPGFNGVAGAAPGDPSGERVNADDYAPAAEPPPAAPLGNRVQRGTVNGVPLYQDAALQSSTRLPELRLDLHVFAAQPQDRFVMINMHKLREGDSLPEGVRVESITPEGAVLSKDGTRFLLPRQ
jgi:general secretion pathway protein B